MNFAKENNFSQVAHLYARALPFLFESNNGLAFECGEAIQRITVIQGIYPHTFKEVKDQIREKYPQITEEIINSWKENRELEYCFYDGEEHFGNIGRLSWRNKNPGYFVEVAYAKVIPQKHTKTSHVRQLRSNMAGLFFCAS